MPLEEQSLDPQHTAATKTQEPSSWPSAPHMAFHHWPNAMPTKRYLPRHGTQPSQSSPILITSKTAMLPPSSPRLHTPWNKSGHVPSQASNSRAYTARPSSNGTSCLLTTKRGIISRPTSPQYTSPVNNPALAQRVPTGTTLPPRQSKPTNALQNIKSTLNHELANLHVANNANHQSMLGNIAELRTALATAQQQLALLAITPTAARPAPNAPNYYAPTAPNYFRNCGGRNNSYRGRGGRGNRNPYTVPTPLAITTMPAPLAITGILPAHNQHSQPNPNKWYNNHNYCYSCRYNVPIWHTSATCNNRKHHHQEGCNRANKEAYKAARHVCSKRNIHKVIMPADPVPEQA
jgi:hypothetical protein